MILQRRGQRDEKTARFDRRVSADVLLRSQGGQKTGAPFYFAGTNGVGDFGHAVSGLPRQCAARIVGRAGVLVEFVAAVTDCAENTQKMLDNRAQAWYNTGWKIKQNSSVLTLRRRSARVNTGMRRFAAGVILDWTTDEADFFRLFFFAIFYETWGA